jgi:hypothetical protein
MKAVDSILWNINIRWLKLNSNELTHKTCRDTPCGYPQTIWRYCIIIDTRFYGYDGAMSF